MGSERSRLRVAFGISLLLHGAVVLLAGAGLGIPGDTTRPGIDRGHAIEIRFLVSRTQSANASTDKEDHNDPAQEWRHNLPDLHPYYFAARDLAIKPVPEVPVDLDSLAPLSMGRDGKATLKLWIDGTGHVDRISISESTLHPNAASAVVDRFQHTRFRPGFREDGEAVGSIIEVEVAFEAQ